MSEVKQDYQAGLDWILKRRNRIHPSDEKAVAAIIHALKLTPVVTGEPTEGMCGSYIDCEDGTFRKYITRNADIFKAMITWAEKEITEGDRKEIEECTEV